MEVQHEDVVLYVSDNGIGIERELQPYVFDLFSQAKRNSDRSQGGLGLGLALVKSLVALHGGTVTCFSEGVGKGARFSVKLPKLLERTATTNGCAESGAVDKAEKPLRILVVDDNVDAAEMLSMLIEALGHHVIVENSSRKAVERARVERPDVCLLDIGLPEMDGNQLAQQLRAHPETAASVLIAVTGYGQENDRKQTLASGFDHHLVKPVDADQLTKLLTDAAKETRVRMLIESSHQQWRHAVK